MKIDQIVQNASKNLETLKKFPGINSPVLLSYMIDVSGRKLAITIFPVDGTSMERFYQLIEDICVQFDTKVFQFKTPYNLCDFFSCDFVLDDLVLKIIYTPSQEECELTYEKFSINVCSGFKCKGDTLD